MTSEKCFGRDLIAAANANATFCVTVLTCVYRVVFSIKGSSPGADSPRVSGLQH